MDRTKMQCPDKKGKTPRKPPRKLPTKQTDHVEVFCRVRPLDSTSDQSCVRRINETTIALAPPENSSALRNGAVYKESQHTFQFVFDEQTTQKSLFDHVALSLVDMLLHCKNALLFTYGVTSSGKTYTMSGSPQNPGILPRSVECIFYNIGELLAKKYTFKPDKMNGFDVQSEADAMLERQNRDVTPRLAGLKTPLSGLVVGASTSSTPVEDLAKIEDIDTDCCYAVFISYVEIYNNYVYDLLDEDQLTINSKTLSSKIIREDIDHNMYVSGVVEVEIANPSEAYDILSKGQKRRKVANTALNSESSRSHSIFTIRLVRCQLDSNRDIIVDKRRVFVSQLSLVDLAGSERSQRTGAAGDRLKEAGNINNSLMALRACIEALRENQKNSSNKLVPYRDSKLTHLFKNYFDGEGKVKMIVCINSKASDYDETVQVMKFAELTQEVQIARPQAPPRLDLPMPPPASTRRLKSTNENCDDDRPSSPVIYSLGPSFPATELFDPRDEQMLSMLAKFLIERDNTRSYLLADLNRKEEAFRIRVMAIEKENSEMKSAKSRMMLTLTEKDAELQDLRRRVDEFAQKIAYYEQERYELEREVGEKSWKLVQEKLEKDHLRQDFSAKLALKEQQLKQTVEQVRRRANEEADVKLRAKQHKLDLMRRVLDSNTPESGGSASSAVDTPSYATGHSSTAAPVAALRSRIYAARSDPDLLDDNSPVESAAAANGGAIGSRRVGQYQRAPVTARAFQPRIVARAKSPPPAVKPKQPVSKKFHRRSRSSESVLVDETIDASLLLQSGERKRRSSTVADFDDDNNGDYDDVGNNGERCRLPGEVIVASKKSKFSGI